MRRRLVVIAILGLLAGLMQLVSASPAHAVDAEYGCNPGSSSWDVKGRWDSGTVLEARTCYHEDDNGMVRVYSYWRTRRGGTPILSDWNLGGYNAETYSYIYSATTGKVYGEMLSGSFLDQFDTSIIQIANWPDCSQIAGSDVYRGHMNGVQANPNGTTDGASSFHSHQGALQDNNVLDCGEQI